jgi:hypothetical protein
VPKLRVPHRAEKLLDAALDKALEIQRPAVLAYVDRLRRNAPFATPQQIITQLERHYRTAVMGIGAAAGAAAAIPGVWTGTALASGAAEITAFLSATAMYVLSVAELHELPVSDPQLRRALVLAVLVGESGEALLAGLEAETPHWAQVLGRSAAKERIAGLNTELARVAMTRAGTRQGALVLGRALPLGIGAGVGAVGNAALARSVIKSARRAFGPPPAQFHGRVIDA